MKKKNHHNRNTFLTSLIIMAVIIGVPISNILLIRSSQGNTATTYAAKNTIFGISDPDLVNEPSKTQISQLRQMASIGITSLRIEVNWDWVQSGGPTSYDWSKLDTEIANIHNAGMSIDIVINGSPSWAAVNGINNGDGQPVSASQFATWAKTVVNRYKYAANIYEIWNEQNSIEFWQPAPNPSAYTQDLIAAYKAIKSVAPQAIVLSGGLAPEANDGKNVNGVTFLQKMYASGAKGHFDALGYHPYSYPAFPNAYESWSGWSQMSATNPSIRSVMATNGDSTKAIWITEVGAPSNGPDGIGNTGEANEFTQVITNAKSTSWINAVYLYSWQDEGTDTTNDENWFGILNYAGAQKPAYNAVKNAIK